MQPRKIAVLRANGLGDFIFALPALFALRESFPAAEIVYLGKKWHKEFLEGRPGPVNRIVVVPPFPGVGEPEDISADPREAANFFSAMRDERFDIAIQIHGGGRHSNPFLRDLGAKLTVGLKTDDAFPLDISIPYIYYHKEVLRYLEVVSKVGAYTSQITPRITVTEKDLLEADRSVRGFRERPLVVLHPGASDFRRRWPAERFAAVADVLAERGVYVCITGTLSEETLVSQVIKQMRYPAENLCGRLTVSGLTGLLSRAALYIGNDTGPLNLAEAVQTPTVGIFWCGNMINAGPMTRSIHRPQISWMINCPRCGADIASGYAFDVRNTCTHNASFVVGVRVEDVIDSALEFIS